MIRFLSVSAFVILFLICSIPLLLIENILGRIHGKWKDRSCLFIIQWAFRCCLKLAGVSTTVLGTENIPKDRAVLYVANHRSYFDILLTYVQVSRPTGFVAKSEMLKAPLLVTWMQNIHCLFLDRKDIKRGLKTILMGAEKIKSGISICIFPEGTRSRKKDTFLPFHNGSFKMAEKAGCPIIPICLTNTGAIWEDHMPIMKKTHVVIEFGTPIFLNELSREEKKNIGRMAQEKIQEMYVKNKSLISENRIP